MGWDEATFQRVKELHRSGVSRRKIANLLGMTAGQVIGKMYRLGLRDAELERPTPTRAHRRQSLDVHRQRRYLWKRWR